MKNKISIAVLTLAFSACCVTVARADQFSFSTGSPDGKLGALSRPAGSQGVETEAADDFVLTQPTVVSGATVHGLITGATASNISRVEVEIYHVFPLDSDTVRTPNVPTRMNSPSDHEISTASRDSNDSGSLSFVASEISDFQVQRRAKKWKFVSLSAHRFFFPQATTSFDLRLRSAVAISCSYLHPSRLHRVRHSRRVLQTCRHGSVTRTSPRIGCALVEISSARARST